MAKPAASRSEIKSQQVHKRTPLTLSPLLGFIDEEEPQQASAAVDSQVLNIRADVATEVPMLILQEIPWKQVEDECASDDLSANAECHHSGGSGTDLLVDLEGARDGRSDSGPSAESSNEQPQTPLPSVGSDGHALGTCRPCAHHSRKGCFKGEACTFCHLCTFDDILRYKERKKANKRRGASNSQHDGSRIG
eukprot:TRINITY_DN69020_c0_g1_i1.p1 TRINITY_DN69020_c0_g1~~TRINITY_DN69020_c0_g1_i1.p1  ORF type:complete len:206 (+),score=29.69 TRINITY_DN69020_c0_g1_i1:40-618(+)